MPATPLPLVWLPADHRDLDLEGPPSRYHVLGDKYARAVREAALAQAVMFPLAAPADVPALLQAVDGVLLTGSPANVHPSHYGQAVANPALPLDPARDAQTFALIRGALAAGVPILGICRGFQEMNVALGGSLHQAVHQTEAFTDHREDERLPLAQQYALAHPVRLAPGTAMAAWAGGETAMVNSLHGQGVDRLAEGLAVLARADDGLVEAFEVSDAPALAVAVQWHPEWQALEYPFYAALFRAFGQACAARRAARLGR